MKIFSENRNILWSVLISYVIFISSVLTFNHNTSRISSYIIVLLSAIIALLFLGRASKIAFGERFILLILTWFFIKLLVGYLFWQFYLFPDYFSDPSSTFHFAHREYLLTADMMKEIAKFRMQHGFFSFPSEMLQSKYIFIHYFMSSLYFTGRFNPLDISIQNTLFSIYTAIIIAEIAKNMNCSSVQIRFAAILILIQPFSIISTIIWRDVVGQFFIALGGLLLIISLNSKTFKALILIILSSLLMFFQRNIYLIFPVLTVGLYYLFSKGSKWRLFLLPLILVVITWVNTKFGLYDQLAEGYGSNMNLTGLLIYLPFNIVRLLIGPFPWSNWLTFDDNTIFLIADYFQAVINIAFIYFSIRSLFLFKKQQDIKYEINLLPILFLMFIFSAFGTISVHSSYLSTGTIFLAPVIVKNCLPKRIYFSFTIIFLTLLIFNLIYQALGLTGQGIGRSFR